MRFRGSIGVEALLAASLLALGFAVGSFASRHFSGVAQFHQGEFGPAVMVAAGRGFVNPVVTPGSPLAEFLSLRSASLDRADLTQVPEGDNPDQFQYGHRYLLLAVGYGWRISGISWPAVSGIAALLYGLSIVAAYGICRVWLSRPLAVAGALFLCFSPLQLAQVPHIRDYSKAPFILLAILLTSLVAMRPLSRRWVVLLSAACGVVVGIGLGFKMDVVIMAPIFLASLVMFRDRRPWTGLGEKALAVGAFVLALFIAAAPVLLRLSSGGTNGFHVILLGYADPFDAGLEITRPAYSILPAYSDIYLTRVIRERAARFTGDPLSFPSPEYDAASRAYWLAIVRHFPADILTRALAAANVILNLPFNSPVLNFLTAPSDRSSPAWNVLTNQLPHRARVGAVFEWLTVLNGWGIVFGVVLIGVAGVQNARLGIFAGWMVLALGAYSSLQFANRHIFHLEIIPIVGVLVAVRVALRRRWPGPVRLRRFAAAVLVLGVATMASLGALRAYQTWHLGRLFQAYIDAPRHPVQPVFTETGHGTWHVRWDGGGGDSSPTRNPAADYYVAEFEGAPGQAAKLLTLRYKDSVPDYSRIVSLASDQGISRILVPAYGDPQARPFDGLELSTSVRSRLRGIYRIDRPEQLPMLLILRLRDDWRRGLYQAFRVGDSGNVTASMPLIGEPASTPVSRVAWLDQVDSPATIPRAEAVKVAYTKAARVTANGIEMDGVAGTQSGYLLGFESVDVKAPAALLVKGHLDAGGLSIGLLKGVQWYHQALIREPGDFVAVVSVAESGTYVPLITNATVRASDRTRFTLSRFGVVHADFPRP